MKSVQVLDKLLAYCFRTIFSINTKTMNNLLDIQLLAVMGLHSKRTNLFLYGFLWNRNAKIQNRLSHFYHIAFHRIEMQRLKKG